MPLTILVADDSRTVLQAVALIVGKDHRLLTASSLQGMQAILREQAVDIIMIDHSLAGGDVLSWCQSFTSKVPVIILGGPQTQQSPWQAAGAFLVLPKPFLAQDFLACVKQAMEHSTRATVHAMQQDTPTAEPHPLNPTELQAAIMQTIEKVAWEVVPALAETLIKEELQRFMQKNP